MFAGAAFTDQADIKVDDEVVNTLVSLGVVQGFEDGSFQPNGTVTRAQMAKMIYVLRTGNSDASAYNDDKTSFTDINGHWARGYIKYCQSLGIIAGKSNTIFAPNANVTAQEAAKMLLVTLGYDPQKAGLVGSSWASKTNALADEAGLLEDVNTSFTAACPRQYAAQLIYNTIFAKTVVLRDGEYTKYGYDNTPNPTVGEKYMGLIEYTGTYEGNSDVITTLKDGEIKVGTQTATFDMDNDLIGEEVTVLFKDHKNGTANKLDTKDTVFGVYATGETKVYRIIKDDMQTPSTSDLKAGKIKFNDKTYEVVNGAYTTATDGTVTADIIVNKNYGATPIAATASEATKKGLATYFTNNLKAQSGDAIKFVCNSDNKIFRAYVTESKLAKVNSVNSDKVSLSGVGSIKFEDNNIYSGIKKNDVVVVTTYFKSSATSDDAYSVVEKAETVTGKLEGFKLTSSSAVTKVTVAGTSYNVDKETLASGLTDDAVTTLNNNNINDEVTLYLVNGYVGAIDAPDVASNYALVESVSATATGDADSIDPFKMKVILADGSEKTVTVDSDSKYLDTTSNHLGASNIPANSIVKYASINSSNVMDLDSVAVKAGDTTKVKTASAANTPVYDKDTKSFDNVMTESDAVLFVNVNNGKDFYAYNLRSLNSIKVGNGAKYASITNNDGKVEAAYVELGAKPSGATSDTVYGIVSKDNGVVKVGDDYQKAYVVSNNEGDYTVYMGASSTKLEKGDIVYFDQASDNVYSDNDVKKLGTDDTTNFLAAYAKELDSDKVLSYYTSVTTETDGTHKGSGTPTNIALENDAKIVYVDKDNNKAGDDIGVNEFDKITGYKNIAVVKNNSGKIDAIIVETSNECDIQ